MSLLIIESLDLKGFELKLHVKVALAPLIHVFVTIFEVSNIALGLTDLIHYTLCQKDCIEWHTNIQGAYRRLV